MIMRSYKNSVLFIAITLLAACSAQQSSSSAKLNVVATNPILGDVVSNIGGDLINLTTLIPVDTDPHSFEPAPQDAARVSEADIVFLNGLNLDDFMQGLMSNAEGHGQVVTVSDGIQTIASDEAEFSSGDPHVWMNPLNMKIWADNIAEGLAVADTANADVYRANADAYKVQLDELEAWAQDQIAQIPAEQRVLVTDHDALGYFLDHYGFQLVGAVIPSFNTGSEPSAGELADLEKAIRQYEVKAIFVGVSVNPALAEQVAADTGVQLIAVYTESLSSAAGPAATYLDMMRYDIETIVGALK
jgi:ABC-type Zn uptake system ZnuABC Zn-binding protein ZnuA